MNAIKTPRVFISYSWSSKEHEKKVLELAESLVGNGIEVVIDKWDLPEGEDKYKFMERAVNDKKIDKVIIISDKTYAEKADKREGGVGTETQIITPQLYEQFGEGEQQSRFVALAFENDENGKPFLPTYYKNRIYIDFSSEESKNENFEQLIRWIFNKPLNKKPEIGIPPFYILSEEQISLNTQAKLKAYNNTLHSNIGNAQGALNDYLETFSTNINKFKMEFENTGNFYEKVTDNIKLFLPYRDEFIDVTFSALKYLDDETISEAFHKYFEDILRYKLILNDQKYKDRMELDNYQFIINELFLYFAAAVLKQHRFKLFNEFLIKKYYIANIQDQEDKVYSYRLLNGYLRSFEIESSKKQQISLTANLMINNASNKKILLIDIFQADFILFLRSEIMSEKNLKRWYPHTALYIASRSPKFELFLRGESIRFFNDFKQCLGIENLEQLNKIATEFEQGVRKSINFYADDFYPPEYINISNLCKSE